MLDYFRKLLRPANDRNIYTPPTDKTHRPGAMSENALREMLSNLLIDKPLLTLSFDPRQQKDSYPAITGGYIVPNGLVLDTPGGRQIIKRSVFRRVKVRQDTATTGTVFLEADDEFIIKLAGLRNFEEVGNVLGTLILFV